MFLSGEAEEAQKKRLQTVLLVLSFVNLFVVAALGVLLRTYPFLSTFPLQYKNLLHGHSHFAFLGWVTPVLLYLIMTCFPDQKSRLPYRHWRNSALLLLASAYGMLASFPLQGYGPVSISFSTLSIIGTVYLALVVWRASDKLAPTTSPNFLKAGLLYACLSAVGPFALGPLVALGKGNSPLYADAIYFYLHFQYNGFFTFAVLAFLYRQLEQEGRPKNGRKVFLLFNNACLPTYALSVLWSQPSVVYNWVGGMGAVMQLVGLMLFLKDLSGAKGFKKILVTRLSLSAFVLKNVLQFLSAFPVFALLVYTQRNLVIAYLHLVLLGFVSMAVFYMTLTKNKWSQAGIAAFFFSFVTTETLLLLNAFSGLLRFDIPYFSYLLLICSLFFPIGIIFLLAGLEGEKTELFSDLKKKQIEQATVPA